MKKYSVILVLAQIYIFQMTGLSEAHPYHEPTLFELTIYPFFYLLFDLLFYLLAGPQAFFWGLVMIVYSLFTVTSIRRWIRLTGVAAFIVGVLIVADKTLVMFGY